MIERRQYGQGQWGNYCRVLTAFSPRAHSLHPTREKSAGSGLFPDVGVTDPYE